ncbi:MAG TPA: helix-turn-helix transcriptional regulator [Vicinamibacterales bacterium]|nr:helix-turn-helix transcriptional regulator [Vicinamibacterales bacterium]
MADRPQGPRRKVASIREARIKRAFDRIEEHYRGKDASKLEAFLEEQVEAEQAMVVSDVVRQAIEESGLSLAELARQASINHGQLSRFMRGERSLTLATLDPLAKVLRLRMVRGKAPRKR